MFRFRFSLLHFLIVITLLAMGLGAFASGSRLAASGAYTLYIGLLCLALAGAFIVRGESRPFWIGFAIFGWIYFLLAFETGTESSQRSWGSILGLSRINMNYYGSEPPAGPRLLTSEAIDFLEEHLVGSREAGSKVMAQWTSGNYYPATIKSYDGSMYTVAWDDGTTPSPVAPAGIKGYTPYARLSGHSLFGALAGLLGGMLVALLFGTQQSKEPTQKTSA